MPVDYGSNVVSSPDLRARLEQFSLQLGQVVRVIRGDVTVLPPQPVGPPLEERRGCLGSLFGGAAPRPRRLPDPAFNQWRDSGEGQHLNGLAADILVDNLTVQETAQAAARSGLFAGVGLVGRGAASVANLPAHTHVDIDEPGTGFDMTGTDVNVVVVNPPVFYPDPNFTPRTWYADDYGTASSWTDPGAPFYTGGGGGYIGDS